LFRDEEGDEATNQAMQQGDGTAAISGTGNPFLDVPNITGATEFKKGYVMRKCCYDSNGKKSMQCLYFLSRRNINYNIYIYLFYIFSIYIFFYIFSIFTSYFIIFHVKYYTAPFGKRGWKMYYCTLRELVLYLHKDEHGFRNDSLHNAIRIHHALATKATDYTKKQHVFRLQTADQAEYLFQTRLVYFAKFRKILLFIK